MAKKKPDISPETDPALAAPAAMPQVAAPPEQPDIAAPSVDMGAPALPEAAMPPAPAAPRSDLVSVPAGQPIPQEQTADATTIAAGPSKESFHAKMRDLGVKETMARRDLLDLDPSDPNFRTKMANSQAMIELVRGEKAHFEQVHPWGSVESAHPGIFGKIGHAFGEIGNIAGDVLAPGITTPIPGSQRNLAAQEQAAQAGVKEAGAEAGEAARAGLATAQTGAVPSEIAAREAGTEKTKAETEQIGEGKKGATEPIYDKAGDLIGFKSGADLLGLHNPKLTPDMLEMAKTAKAPQKDEKTPPHITSLGPDGKSHIMERDPKTGEYSIDRGLAPPNYAQVAPGIRTVDIISPKTGLPTVTTLAGKEIGTAGTGAYGTEMSQAGAVTRAGTQLIGDLERNKAKLGTLEAWVKKYGLNTPIADKDLSGLQASISTFASLQPAMHGFRSRNALEVFEKIIGGVQKNPDAIIEAIRGIMKTAGAINPNLPNLQSPSGPPAGATHIGTSKLDGKKYYLDAQGKKLGPAE